LLWQVQSGSQATDAKRTKELFDKKVISEKEYTNKKQINESNVAKVKALEAGVEQAQLNLDFCKITSPVEGIAGIAQAQVPRAFPPRGEVQRRKAARKESDGTRATRAGGSLTTIRGLRIRS
jgi:multidrug efflux pump subunit AcrA (membrane-fusion protein)